MSATKFLCVKTSSSNVVVRPLPYLMVHRYCREKQAFNLKFSLELSHPFEKRRLRQISAYNVSTARDSEKIQLWRIGNRAELSNEL